MTTLQGHWVTVFQSRPRMGSDRTDPGPSAAPRNTNPRPRMGLDTVKGRAIPFKWVFNPPPPGRPLLVVVFKLPRIVSIHTCMGNGGGQVQSYWTKVSIRPAWGATGKKRKKRTKIFFCSIHAPAWGATEPDGRANAAGGVSIHAPAWATFSCIQAYGFPWFQSTPPHGATRRMLAFSDGKVFQSTPRMGSDLSQFTAL